MDSMKANYRKHNDGSQNSSTYHKKDGTAVRAKLKRLSYTELGEIMLKEAGEAACQKGYQTTDPEWVGRYALDFRDINPDGTLN